MKENPLETDIRTGMMYLLDTFTSDFKVVDILIDTDGEAERIFEAINNRGRTFNEFDHLRNNIFLQARVHPQALKVLDEKEAHQKHLKCHRLFRPKFRKVKISFFVENL